MNTIKDKKIAIIGGGPGGLTLARLLQLKGADVTVYERDLHEDARAQGATLDLHEESGLAALQAAGLMDEFRANYRPGADKMRVTDEHANIVLDDHIGEQDETYRGRPEIDRGPLQKLLLESLNTGTVVWNSQFSALTPYNNGWKIEFKNGTTAVADLVIAADGASSKLRPYLTPIKSFYCGYTAVEGAVYHSETTSPEMHQLLSGGKIFAMGDNRSLIVSAKGDGSMTFYPCFKADENWVKESGIDFKDKARVLAWFKTEFANWGDIWTTLFEHASGAFTPRPLYSMPLDQTWEAQPNLTMLGDAAHLMPPYAGEGVNMAMLDALELSRALTDESYTDTLAAITAFEKQMRIRASEVADQSIQSLEILHSPGAIDFMTRIAG
ncbi:MAG: NAD(P)/FAD-dependent oxidoreductase [Mucilaginibacter sp.]|jgi:2-polyprenyl-6-methoxyphenol hydroxylase-like FAD-dependent oxidoreductase|uniref:FAD-dependent oxidoreductase n=1 Tax=Mucilaginibacter sp. TaxID=1882438 RepID=UPI0035643F1F